MKYVYIITYAPTGEIHKVFSSREHADKYFEQLAAEDNVLYWELDDIEEVKVTQ